MPRIDAPTTLRAISEIYNDITGQRFGQKFGLHVINLASLEQLIASGQISGAKRISVFGYNSAASTTEQDVHSIGGKLTPLTSAQTIEVISSSANDAAAGSGARTVMIEGLDANFQEISEEITTNGTSASSASTQSFLRINRAYVASRGTYSSANAGTITVRVSGAGQSLTAIPTTTSFGGLGESFSTHYTIPSGKIGFLYAVLINPDAVKKIDVAGTFRLNGSNLTTAPFGDILIKPFFYMGLDRAIQFDNQDTPYFLAPRTDVFFSCTMPSGQAGTGQISVQYSLITMDVPS